MPNSARLRHAAEFHCRSAANPRKRRPISAVGWHGQNGLKRLITIRFPKPMRQFSRAKTEFSAGDSGIAAACDALPPTGKSWSGEIAKRRLAIEVRRDKRIAVRVGRSDRQGDFRKPRGRSPGSCWRTRSHVRAASWSRPSQTRLRRYARIALGPGSARPAVVDDQMVDLRRVVRIGEIIQPDPDRGGRRARVDEQRPLNADSRYRLAPGGLISRPGLPITALKNDCSARTEAATVAKLCLSGKEKYASRL